MVTKINPLIPAETPLNSHVLIEASAGTGKTYTIASLYLRLLLNVGKNKFPRALTVEEILVVTFTDAATEELKSRIRSRIHLAKNQLLDFQKNQNKQIFLGTDNAILVEFLDELTENAESLELAIRRLSYAEQNMDVAAIFTIHSFCQRMLKQFAFNSGISFDIEIQENDTALLQQFAAEFWRKYFYHQSFAVASFVHKHLQSPEAVVKSFRGLLANDSFKINAEYNSLLALPVDDFLVEYVENTYQNIAEFKQNWLKQEQEIQELILQAKQKKWIKLASYQDRHLLSRYQKIAQWAKSSSYDLAEITDPLKKYFSQQNINELYLQDENEKVEHPLFSKIDELYLLVEQEPLRANIVRYHYLNWLKQELAKYKVTHKEKSFDDLLLLLKNALLEDKEKVLAKLICHQYPFAMIDEFQDTDEMQYEIFSQIYPKTTAEPTGFIMIGDPKQSIYQFRGADIFTYLKASQQVEPQNRFSLSKNYRSEKNLIQTVNHFLDFKNANPFIYEDIAFEPVESGKSAPHFTIDSQPQLPITAFIVDTKDYASQAAKLCAAEISRWLTNKQTGLQLSEQIKAIQPQNIAILVRTGFEAEEIKKALSEYQIASVFLSDKSNVFNSQEARDLFYILQACLNPFNERRILAAIGTSIFSLTAQQIQQIKYNELQWELWVNRFAEYQKIWEKRGVLAMLHQLFLQEQILSKLQNQAGAERRITDLFHLAELLQEASMLNDTHNSLLNWFQNQLMESDIQSKNLIIRLESEQELVKIVTFHKSKGLEYDVIFLPFVGKPLRKENKNQGYKLLTYHNDQKQVIWDVADKEKLLAQKEDLAENLRLLYVALTRAKSHISMVLPQTFEKTWNAIWYCLSQGQIGDKAEVASSAQVEELIQAFNLRHPQSITIGKNNFEGEKNISEHSSLDLVSSEFHQQIERNWTVTSFTGLSRIHEHLTQKNLQNKIENNDYLFDEARDVEQSEISLNMELTNDEPIYNAFTFPKGNQAGLALHNYFEQSYFQAVNEIQVQQICETLHLDKDLWFTPIYHWIENIFTTPLLPEKHLTLNQIKDKDCLKEMEFYLNLENNFDVKKFNQILKKYHHLPSSYQFEEIKGVVRGFIDLVFRFDGKYYLLDYKSNFLGETFADYQQEKLTEAMLDHHYDLQYLIYTLALHRYLKNKLPDYQYSKYFGGVIYTFLRGMNGEQSTEQTGVFYDMPSENLIIELDALF